MKSERHQQPIQTMVTTTTTAIPAILNLLNQPPTLLVKKLASVSSLILYRQRERMAVSIAILLDNIGFEILSGSIEHRTY